MENTSANRSKFNTSPEAQIARIKERMERDAEMVARISENMQSHEIETPEERTARLRHNRVRRGKEHARYKISGCSNSKNLQRCFELLYNRWRDSKTGFDGLELTEAEIGRRLHCSERHARRLLGILSELDLLVTIRHSGKPNRYAVSLPEPESYLQCLDYALECVAEQLWTNPDVDEVLYEEAVEAGFIKADPGQIAA